MLNNATTAEIRRAARIQPGGKIAGTINLNACGLRVRFTPSHATSRGLDAGRTFEISEVAGADGEDAFMRLQTLDGQDVPRWHRATELTTVGAVAVSKMPPVESGAEGKINMNNTIAADRFQKRVTQLATSGEPWAKAIKIAGHEDEFGARAFRFSTMTATGGVTADTVLSLSAAVEAKAKSGADFDALVGMFQAETNCGWAQAVRVVAARFPVLAERR
jgi:hypothetical protein